MSLFQWANNVNTTLAAAITNTQTTITLASSSGLPSSIPAGVYLPITLNDAATRSVFEVLYATAVSGATLTVIRGQEGTTPQAWNTGDYAYSTISAGSLSSLLPTQTALQIITVSGPQTITPKALTTLVYPNASSVAITLEAGTGQGQRVVVYGNAGTVTVNSSVSSGSPYFGFPDGTVAYSWIVASIGYLSGYFSGIEMVYDGANWRCETFGQTIVAPAAASNEAVSLGQFVNSVSGGTVSGVLPNGFKIFGGATSLYGTSNSAQTTTITFPGTFSNIPITIANWGGTSPPNNASISSVSAGVTEIKITISVNGTASNPYAVNWLAVGV